MLCHERYRYMQAFGLYNIAAMSFPVDRQTFSYPEVGLGRKFRGE
jgi:hypothetical protein